ncbi:MAG: hypothetical protein ACI9XP_000299 [Lentimonas sp.]|jgi:hypothetical protein
MKLFVYPLFAFFALIVVSCSNNDVNSDLSECVASYVENDKTVITFGRIDVQTILDKAEYVKIPIFGELVSKEIQSVSSALDIKSVYYAINGPVDTRNNPEATSLFFKVNNMDSLALALSQRGYDTEEKGGKYYLYNGDVKVMFDEGLAILRVENSKQKGFKNIEKAFDLSKKGKGKGNVKKFLAAEGDITSFVSLEAAYVETNEKIADLDESKRDELKSLTKDGYIENSVRFEMGQLRIVNINHFNEKLQAQKFFNADESGSVRNKLGKGQARLAVSVNLNFKNIQSFVDEFAPGAISNMIQDIGGPLQMAFMMAGGDISNILSGQFAAAMFGEPKADGTLVPDFNFYAGFGPNGKPLADLAKDFLKGGEIALSISPDAVMGASEESNLPVGSIPISVPAGAESFGKNTLTAFVNLEGADMSSFEFEGAAILIYLVKNVNMNYGATGGETIVRLKNSKQNVLKQAVDKMLVEFEDLIN